MTAVFKAYSIIESEIVQEPDRSVSKVVSILLAMEYRGKGPAWTWTVPVTIGEGPGRREMQIPLPPFVTADEYERSCAEPLGFSAPPADDKGNVRSLRWIWLYRDGIYATERDPKPSEMAEVALRVKALHFRRDRAMRRLSEQVANSEAIESQMRSGQSRKPIPDDVKLLVWTRDGGVCVKCGSAKDPHFTASSRSHEVAATTRRTSNSCAALQPSEGRPARVIP